MGKPSLFNQLKMAVDNGFSRGADKHSAKQTDEWGNGEHVWGDKDRKNLYDVGHQLTDYIKKEFGIKDITDIKPVHVQSWFDAKSCTCNQNTLDNYLSRIGKLGTLVEKRFKANLGWKGHVFLPASKISMEKNRTQVMTSEDMRSIVQYSYSTKSQCSTAIDFSSRTGLRPTSLARMTVSDLDFEHNRFHYIGKGGRHATLPMQEKNMPFFRSLAEGRQPQESLFGVRAGSIQRQVGRSKEALGLSAKYEKTGLHANRKAWAQMKWDEYKAAGMSPKEAGLQVCKDLGHSSYRTDVLKTYVANQC